MDVGIWDRLGFQPNTTLEFLFLTCVKKSSLTPHRNVQVSESNVSLGHISYTNTHTHALTQACTLYGCQIST